MAAVPSTGRADYADRAAAPEADATRALYERYANQIFGYCLHQLGSREEAEDAVQSTFLNAFRGLRRGVVPELEAAWLFKIAHNVCLSRRRSSWRRGRIESPADFDLVEELAPAPARQSDELIGLQDVLETMPENQRRAILLREWQGLSYREIGDELELSQAAVETLIFRARRSLAQGLEQPPKPARRRARAAGDFGNILAGIKSLLFSGAAAVKVAATVAVVSATTVAVTAPVQQHRQHHKASAPRTPSSVAASAQPGGSVLAPSPAAVLAPGKGVAAKHGRAAGFAASLSLPSFGASATADGATTAADPQATTTTPESQPASEPAAQPQAPAPAPASAPAAPAAPAAAPAAPATPASATPATPTKVQTQGTGDGGTATTQTTVTTLTPTAPLAQTNGGTNGGSSSSGQDQGSSGSSAGSGSSTSGSTSSSSSGSSSSGSQSSPPPPQKIPAPSPGSGSGTSDSSTTTVVTLLNPKIGPPVANTNSTGSPSSSPPASTPPVTTKTTTTTTTKTTTTTSTSTVTGKKLPATTSSSSTTP